MLMGVRALKARLSWSLRQAEAGMTITIADRGRPIARLGPVSDAPPAGWVRALLAERKATWSGGRPKGLAARVPSRGRPASAGIIADRR